MLARHLDHHQNPEKLLVVSGTSPHMFETFDCEAPASGIVMNHTHYKYSDLILWNPLTSDYKTLSKTHKECYYREWGTYGLFYSSCEDDYKLVCWTVFNKVYIYSLKSDSWRCFNYSLQVDDVWYLNSGFRSICLNENLYFKNYAKKRSVIRFDTNIEKFEVIEAPFVGSFDEYKENATLMVQRGCLHFCIMIDGGRTGLKETCIQLWKMVEDGCWNNVVTYHVDRYHIRSLTPLHLMRNGKLLMLDNVGSALYEVDLVKEKHSKGKEKWWRNAPRALYEVVLKKKHLSKKKDEWCKLISMGVSDQVRYTETFVPPNLYIK
ncbi:F-box/kelch-repeat protein-like protein [Tanacetum coccineum]